MKFVLKALIEDEGEYLVIRRPENTSRYAGCWDLPGGKLGEKEDQMDGLKREVKEEIGLSIVPELKIFSFGITNEKKEQVQFVLYKAKLYRKGSKVKLNDEHTDYKWVTDEEMRNLRGCREILLEKYIQKMMG